jgi:hypothetical protein
VGSSNSASTITESAATGPPKKTGRVVLGEIGEVGHDVGDQRLRRAVEHEAHRALAGVLGDQDHGAVEVGVDQGR